MKLIQAFYRDVSAVTTAVRALNEAHVESDQIRILGVSGDDRRPLPIETKVADVTSTLYGTIGGLSLGVLGAVLIEFGLLVDPGIGFVADTSLVTALRFLAMGAASGALAGYIWGMAIWRIEIHGSDGYDSFIVNIRASERRLDELEAVFESTGAERVEVADLKRTRDRTQPLSASA